MTNLIGQAVGQNDSAGPSSAGVSQPGLHHSHYSHHPSHPQHPHAVITDIDASDTSSENNIDTPDDYGPAFTAPLQPAPAPPNNTPSTHVHGQDGWPCSCGYMPKPVLHRAIGELVADFDPVAKQLSPLSALMEKLETFFSQGPDAAFRLFKEIEFGVLNQCSIVGRRVRITGCPCRIERDGPHSHQHLWMDGDIATALVLVLAAPNTMEAMVGALRLQDYSTWEPKTYEEFRTIRSASLQSAFEEAKVLALERCRTTILGVQLVDPCKYDRHQVYFSDKTFFFDHSFVFGIGPEGVVIWQAWDDGVREHGYRLDEWIETGGARLRDWDEAQEWVRTFELLTAHKGAWNARINQLYDELFGADLSELCAHSSRLGQLPPQVTAWVRIHPLREVVLNNVNKFSITRETTPCAVAGEVNGGRVCPRMNM